VAISGREQRGVPESDAGQEQRLIGIRSGRGAAQGVARRRRDGPRLSGEPAMKGDNLTEQFSRRTPTDNGRQVAHQDLFRVAGQEAGQRDPAARSVAPSAAAQPSWDVFSHGSEYDVAEQQRPEHDEVAMRSLQLPFEADVDVVDAIDQWRSVPVDEDDYR
jgi:hypothetical protein